ncbi:MAG: prenyltransferase [Gammaproteobacteria bacterium]|nr:prenyltransferase [Gammaproteobacteria bacterium]MCW8909209.1 prenyltransferase [Gammaproteobacteria bacterium]MCW9005188.1 prenyltransferase [Gammaproteobacteria bacterium]
MSEPSVDVFHGQTTSNKIVTYVAATRPPFLTASVLPVIAGFGLVWGMQGSLNFVLAVLTVLNIIFIHSGANVLNDYFDSRNGSDAANNDRVFPFSGGSRFIQNGILTEEQTFRFGFSLMMLGAVLGVAMTVITGPFILIIGLTGGLLAIFYSAPPCLACRGLGDIVIAICFGVLPVVGTVFIQNGSIINEAIWLGAVIGCFVSAILWVNSIPDIEADKKAGKKTLPVRLGKNLAVYGLAIWFILGFVILLVSPLPVSSYIGLLAIIPAVKAAKALLGGDLIPAIPMTLVTHTAVCLLLAVGCAI